jgi:ADP-heptose:LPS heptosyltransferase
MNRVLAVRLDSDGDVLITGPAIRALASTADRVDLLVSPVGRAAAGLLPKVDEILTFDAPWTGYQPADFDNAAFRAITGRLRRRRYTRAVIFTSFHQSPLPMALLARLARIPFVAGTSVDYPGSLLDIRHQRPAGHEVDAALDLAVAAGGKLPAGDDGRLQIRCMPVDSGLIRNTLPADGRYIVVHPGASVPARSLTAEHAAAIVAALSGAGWPVVVTGGPADGELTRHAAGTAGLNLAGRTDLPGLAAVLAGAACVVVGNTGPAHLAAAVGTPVVSLFSPVVPAERWRPYGVPTILLGDQREACRNSRARTCPVAGHPCLSRVPVAAVVDAVNQLVMTGGPTAVDLQGNRPSTSVPGAVSDTLGAA